MLAARIDSIEADSIQHFTPAIHHLAPGNNAETFTRQASKQNCERSQSSAVSTRKDFQ